MESLNWYQSQNPSNNIIHIRTALDSLNKEEETVNPRIKAGRLKMSLDDPNKELKNEYADVLEKAKTVTVKRLGNLQEARDNLVELQKILPDLSLEENLLDQFDKLRLKIEREKKQLSENRADSPEAITNVIDALKDTKRELKTLILKVEKAVQIWEDQLGKIGLDVDTEDHISAEYGNKYARLIEQVKILQRIQLPGVEVPIPQGVSNSQIRQFLRSVNSGKDLEEIESIWNDLSKRYDAFGKKNLPSAEFLKEIKPELEQIHQLITDAFSKAATDDLAYKQLNLSTDFLALIEKLREEENYLMLRSSGAEDTRKNANAGGNISVPYVKPERAEVCRGLGEVITSYFSESSLQNRLNIGENPFSSPVKLAVIAQELIGEPPGGAENPADIPVSLVLFSNEPTYVGNEPFRLMRISATYGHGEGVVGAAGIKSDTILILKSVKHPDRLYIVENNQAKPKRLAPIRNSTTGKIELKKFDNPSSLADTPALDHAMLTRLYYLGVAVEKAYQGHPMDMEIVVRNGKIYPVQARPVNRPPANPTYFDFKKAQNTQAVASQFQIEAILPGIAQTQVLRSKDEILIADNLEKAEKMFKKGIHKLVIVREEDPHNSHPVVNFSSMGIPVMHHEKKEEIQDLVSKINQDHALIACVQSGNLILWDNRILAPDSCISPGYIVHPAKVTVSVDHSRLPPSATKIEIPQEVKDLTAKLIALDTEDVALNATKSLKNQDFIVKLKAKRKMLAQKIDKNPNAPERAKILVKGLENLEKAFARAASELKSTLKQEEKGRLHPLFHGKVVEKLMAQPEAPRGLGQLSVVNVEAQIRSIEEIFLYQESFNFPTVLHEEILDASACVVPEQKNQWVNFLRVLENGHNQGTIQREQMDQLKLLLNTVRELDLLPLWMSRFFLPEAKKGITAENIQDTLANLLESINPETEKLLGEMHDILQEIRNTQDNLGVFSDPATFDKGFEQLMHLYKLFSSPEGVTKDVTPLGRIATFQVMWAFVELFDSSIKSMKRSSIIGDEEKVVLFDRILTPYFELLKGWSMNLSGDLLFYHENWPLEKYLNNLELKLNNKSTDTKELSPSDHFSVMHAVLGGATNFNQPQTKEDIFTMVHQSLLFSLGALLKDEMKDKAELPPLMVQAGAFAEKIPNLPSTNYFKPPLTSDVISYSRGAKGKAQLTNYLFTQDQIKLFYNYPLRNHSAKLAIKFDNKTQSGTVEMNIFGGGSAYRYDTMAGTLKVLDYFKFIELSATPESTENTLKFSLNLKDSNSIENSFTEIQQQAQYSLEIGGTYFLPEWISQNHGEDQIIKCILDTQVVNDKLFGKYLNQYIKNWDPEKAGEKEALQLADLFLTNPAWINPETRMIFLKKIKELPILEKIKNEIQNAVSLKTFNQDGLADFLKELIDTKQLSDKETVDILLEAFTFTKAEKDSHALKIWQELSEHFIDKGIEPERIKMKSREILATVNPKGRGRKKIVRK
jgi:Pyruvate phosphate dikinase, AMP/ATP-binding domain